MTILGKGVGVLMKGSGSGSPTFVIDSTQDDEPINYPYKVIVKRGAEGAADVYVMPGTCNNRMTKIGSSYLDASEAPKLSFSTVTSSGKKIVALKVTYGTSTFFPQASEIVLLDNEEALADTDTYGHLQLASITASNLSPGVRVISINQFIHASQIVVRAKPGSGTATWSFLSR